MKIAVSMRVVANSGYHEWRDALSHDWIEWLASLGVEPLLIPNALPEPERFLTVFDVVGVILVGGDDPDPFILSPPGATGRPNDDPPRLRDWTEARILAHAVERRMPVLGVCRGLETINLFFGGAVSPDIAGLTGERHVATSHVVELTNARLGRRAGAVVRVNSFHNQGVRSDDLAETLTVLARTHGDVVEALAHRELPIVAVQWHPERSGSDVEFDRSVFGACFGLTG